jgi:lipopolysaccharide transport system ATP-binding protein
MTYIKAENLKFNYPLLSSKQNLNFKGNVGGKLNTQNIDNQNISVLNGINFSFFEGDRVGLFGNNGSGKTTLLRLLAGIFEPTEGKIEIEGRVGVFLDSYSGFDYEGTGYDNIIMRSMLLEIDQNYVKSKLDEIVEFSEIGDFVYLPIKTYSAGMLSRLAFALVNLVDPDIYLIDESIGTGDKNFQKKIAMKFEEIITKKKIVICASHSLELINTICNKGINLNNGKINDSSNLEPKNKVII